MALALFVAFAIVYIVLALSYGKSARQRKLFTFGFLISVLYGSVYAVYPEAYLVPIIILTSLAILTQHFHIRSIQRGDVKPTKMVVDITARPHWEKGMVAATRRTSGKRAQLRRKR